MSHLLVISAGMGTPSSSRMRRRCVSSESPAMFSITRSEHVPSPLGKPAWAITAPSFHHAHKSAASSGVAFLMFRLS